MRDLNVFCNKVSIYCWNDFECGCGNKFSKVKWIENSII